MSSFLFSSSSSSSSSSSLSMPFMSIGFVLFLLLTTKTTANTSASTTTITKIETLLFPGIYTLRYNNNDDNNNDNDNNTGSSIIKQWTTAFDFIKTECNNSNNQKEEEEEEERHYNHQHCMVHLLLHSRMEYKDALSSMPSLVSSSSSLSSSLSLSSSSSSSASLLLPNHLEYNSLLTKKWITPRLQVTKEERIKKKNKNENKNSSRRRRQQQEGDDDYYSTIDTYDCYYDMKGTIQWIENFVKKYQNSSSLLEVEWIDIGDSYLKSKYIESKSNEEESSGSSSSVGDKLSQLQQQQGESNEDTEEHDKDKGHDIMVLTITGKANSKKKTSSSSSSSSTTTNSTSSNNNGKKNYKAPFILISSTHAREYTPPELIRRWLEHLIDELEQDNNDYLSIFETTKLHWIPYLNPDGRELAETIQPLRRKNLNQNWTGNIRDSNYCTSDSSGVDLNRNFPFEWGKSDGSSNKPCSSSTRGAKANSEVETNAIVNYILSSSEDTDNHPAVFPNLQNQLKENTIATSEGDFNINHIPNLSVEVSSTKWKGYNERTTQGIFVDIHSYGEVYM
jgi:hypothetical protein